MRGAVEAGSRAPQSKPCIHSHFMQSALPAGIFSSLIHEAIDAVVIIDSQGIIHYTNAAFDALCGYPAAEVTGKSLNGLLPEAVAAHHDASIQKYLQRRGGPSTVLGIVREMQLRRRDGDIIPVEMKAVEIGKVEQRHYFAAFMVDLRPRKLLEAQNEALLAEFQRLALTDALTGLPNRRAFDAEVSRTLAIARRENRPFCVGIADLDRFKRVNDMYGHHGGDRVLQAIATTLKESLRAGDFIGRTGGEEFGIIFSVSDLDTAYTVANRVRQAVEDREIAINDTNISMTISIGIACVAPGGVLEEAINRADKALYRAKDKGRNRVEVEAGCA